MPSYRFDDAIKAGVPIEEINQEASSRIGYKYAEAKAAGVSDEEILAELRSRFGKVEKPDVNTQAAKTMLQRAAGGLVGTVGGLADVAGGAMTGAAGLLLKGIGGLRDGPALAEEAVNAAIAETYPSVTKTLINKLGLEGEYQRGAEGASQAMMAPVEGLMSIIHAPGNIAESQLPNLGVSPETAKQVGATLRTGAEGAMFMAPVAKGVGKAITKQPVPDAVKTSPLADTPVAEPIVTGVSRDPGKIGFKFNRQDVPTNFKGEPVYARSTYIEDEAIAKAEEQLNQNKPQQPSGPITDARRQLPNFEQRQQPILVNEQGVAVPMRDATNLDTYRAAAEQKQREATQAQPLPYERVTEPFEPPLIEGTARRVDEGLPYVEEVGSAKVEAAIEALKQREIDLAYRAQAFEQNKPTLSKESAFAEMEKLQAEQAAIDSARRQLFEEQSLREPSQSSPLTEPMIGGIRNRATGRQSGAVDPRVFLEMFPNFRGTKLADTNGLPILLYHGTSKDIPFKNFKDNSRGTWLTKDPEIASQYAKENDSMGYTQDGWKLTPKNTSSRVMQVYADVKNPYYLSEAEVKQYTSSPNYSKMQREFMAKAKAQGYDAVMYPDGAIAVASAKQIQSAISPDVPKVGSGGTAIDGRGKKEGGAIGFDFSPLKETVDQFIMRKKAEGSKASDTALANAYADLQQRGALLDQKLVKAEALRNLQKKINAPFTAETTVTPDEAAYGVAMGLFKDIDSNKFLKLINSPARALGSTYGIRDFYQNPILEAVMRPLSKAADAAKYRADHELHGKDGLATAIRNMRREDFDAMIDRLRNVEGTDVANVFEGLSPEATRVGQRIKQAVDRNLASKNAAREALGKKPISARANWIGGSFYGDRVFQAHDSKGNLVAHVMGSVDDLAAARKWLTENRPDVVIGPEKSAIKVEGRSVADNMAELYDMLLNETKDGTSVMDALEKAISDARSAETAKTKGAYFHEKYKKDIAVLGAKGFEPWLERGKNNDNLVKSLVKQIEDTILYEELAKANATLQSYRAKLGDLNAVKLADSKMKQMQGKATAVDRLENHIAKYMSDEYGFSTGMGNKIGKVVTPLMNTAYFSLNIANMLVNIGEFAVKVPVGMLEGSKQAEFRSALPIYATHGALKSVVHNAMLALKGKKPLEGDFKAIHERAMELNIGNPTIESSARVTPHTAASKAGEAAMESLNKTISLPEYAVRYESFVTLSHTFRAMGLSLDHSMNLAHDLTKKNFKDYSPLEMAALFHNLGTLGRTGRQLRTWVTGEVMVYSAAIKNGGLGAASLLAGLTALIYGADSVPLFKQFDELANGIRSILVRNADTPKEAIKRAEYLTPREYLYQQLDGDMRGALDRSLEPYIHGSTMGSTEWRLFPEDGWGVLGSIDFGKRIAVGAYEAGKEIAREDTNLWAVAKNSPLGTATPKIVGRAIEGFGLMDKEGNIQNPSNYGNVTKTLKDSPDKRAYFAMGMQPADDANRRVGEELDLRRMEAVDERRVKARENLVGAWNNLQLDPTAKDRYNEAVKSFVTSYAGAKTTQQSMKNVLMAVAKEMKMSPVQLKKLAAIKNAKNNMEVVKFFTDVTGTPKQRKGD